jgi:filamentous hemagglutinin family protein
MKYPSQRHSSAYLLAGDLSRPARPPLRISRLAHALAASSLLTLWPGATTLHAQTLPSGMNTVAGQATARTVGSTLTVTNAPGTILNWNSFSIGAQNAVRFEQVNASSQVLNRVTGTDPSSILGSLSSNGRVWLLNPNGVLFGQGARVDVASLVTSTLNLNDSDWLAGRYRFTQGSGPAADIVNQGDLRSSLGGHIALIGGTVRNEGDITAPGGQIVLAAGSDIELLDTATPNVIVKVNAGEGSALNLGQLMAAGGRIDIHAATVNQNGIVRADALQSGPGGEVVLLARDQLNLGAASQTTANGDSGGKITLQADQTMVRGEIGATGSQGAGGQVQLLGRQVGLLDAARVDASGAGGGGEVLVGGGQQGKDPNVPNAQAVYFGPQASITADATANGDGGRINLWSDQATRAFGSLSVRGGPLGGNGGVIETSGHWLDARPARVDTSAPRGRSGSWLLDPYDITVTDDIYATNQGTDSSFTANADSAIVTWNTISSALTSGTQVTVSTSATGAEGTQAGNISISVLASPSVTVGTGGSLTFIADGSISIAANSTLDFGGASMPLTFLAGRSGAGVIQLPSTTITLQNGDMTFGGFTTYNKAGGGTFQGATGYDATHPAGVDFNSANLTAQAGTITINGGSKYLGVGAGVSLSNYSSPLANNILINGNTADFGTTGAGISTSLTTLEAYQTMDLRGMGTTQGIVIGQGTQLILTASSSNSSMRLFGVGLQNEGTWLDGSNTPFSLIFDKTGGSVEIDGSTNASNTAAVKIVGPGTSAKVIDVSGSTTGGTTLTIGGVGTSTELDNAIVSANPTDSNGMPFTLQGGQTLTLTNSQITSGGPITVHADTLHLGSGTTITGNFAGQTAVVLQGTGNGAIQTFDNLAGATALSTPNSRWLVFAQDPVGFATGGLAYDFKRYNALPDNTAITTDVGNGLGFAKPEIATVTGYVVPKTYDGTTVASVLPETINVAGVNQDVVTSITASSASFSDANAGTAKAVSMSGISFTVQDANAKPVYGYTSQSAMLGDINPAPLTVAVNGVNKVYDATTQATVVTAITGGLVGSETVGLSGTASFGTKDVGSAKPLTYSLQLSDGVNGGLASNYTVSTMPSASADITPASLAVSGLVANNKVYDTTTLATLSGAASVTPLGSDAVAVTGSPTASFSDKNAGSAKSVAVTGFTLSGTDAGNYSLLQPSGLSADITPATLAISGLVGNPKVYDATTSEGLSGTPFVSPLGSDSVFVSGSPTANFLDKNVGSGKAVQVSGYTLSGVDAGNYAVTQPTGVTGDIIPATLVVSGLVANSKVYDATTLATLSGSAIVTPLGSDSVSVSGAPAGTFSDKNVGTAKSVAVSGITLSGTDAGNYIPIAPGGLVADITPASLAVIGLVANNKVYDTTTLATLSGTASVTPLGSDSVAVTGSASASFADKNVGSAKSVAVGGLTLSGTDAGNYSVLQPSGLNADITPASLAINGLTANSKVYDATTLATLSGSANVTPLGSDSVSVSGTPTGTFSDKNVGTAKIVSISAFSLTGADAGNYIPIAPGGLSADITPASLAISGLVANSKVYDATTLATLSGAASVTPLGSDSVAVAGSASASFADKNVGAAKSVAVSGFILSGTDAGNYSLLQPSSLSADITPASLTVSGLVASSKVYDTTTLATLSGTASVTPLGSDSVSVSGTPVGTFSDKNVGTAKSVAIGALSLTGADAGNYSLFQPSGLSADITPASLAIGGLSANSKVYDATAAATLSGTASVTPLGSDSVAVTGSPTASFSSPNVGTGKSVLVSGLGLTGADAANYLLPASFTATANIAPATLYYLAALVTQPAGTPPPALTGNVYGLVGSESLSSATAGALSFTTTATAQSLPGAYPIFGGGLSALNYNFAQDPSNATAFNYTGSSPAQASVAVSTAPSVLVPQLMAHPLSVPDPNKSGVVNLIPAARPPSSTPPPTAGAIAFAPVRLSDLSPSAVQGMLDARASYMQFTLSDSISQLEKDPTLADLPACQSPQDLSSGTCLITADMKREMHAGRPGQSLAARSQAAPASDRPIDKPVAKTAVAPAPAPTPAPLVGTAAVAPRPVLVDLPEALLHLSTPRVKVANLPQIVRKVALVIGVNQYTDPTIPTLSNAVGDARAIGQVFESQLGYESIVLENPSKRTVVAALTQLSLALDPKDSVVVYYAGHGQLIESTGLGYWLLSDSDAKQPQTWLSNADIGRLVKQIDASQVALISDSCYSGSLVSAQRIRATPGTMDPQQVLSRRSAVVMSSGGNEPVADEGRDGHSPFAWNLMNNLRQLSKWQPGGNVFERVRFAVARALPQRPQYGAFGAAGDQGGGDYLFEQRQLESAPQ